MHFHSSLSRSRKTQQSIKHFAKVLVLESTTKFHAKVAKAYVISMFGVT